MEAKPVVPLRPPLVSTRFCPTIRFARPLSLSPSLSRLLASPLPSLSLCPSLPSSLFTPFAHERVRSTSLPRIYTREKANGYASRLKATLFHPSPPVPPLPLVVCLHERSRADYYGLVHGNGGNGAWIFDLEPRFARTPVPSRYFTGTLESTGLKRVLVYSGLFAVRRVPGFDETFLEICGNVYFLVFSFFRSRCANFLSLPLSLLKNA